MRMLCQFFRTPTEAERAELPGLPDDAVLGCDDEQGPGPLYFFVPVRGGAVRVGVCPRHADLLAEHHGTDALAKREESLRAAGVAEGDDQDDAAVSDDWPPPASAPFSRIPSNEEWAESKAWARRFVAQRRELERLARREWIEGVRRRLGLVTEVHRCRVYEPNPDDDWAWSCQRAGCGTSDYGYPTQPTAFAKALAHARAFVPKPVEEAPVTELDALAFDAAWARMRAEQDAFAARLPDRIAAVTEMVSERFAGELPEGMRIEWVTGE